MKGDLCLYLFTALCLCRCLGEPCAEGVELALGHGNLPFQALVADLRHCWRTAGPSPSLNGTRARAGAETTAARGLLGPADLSQSGTRTPPKQGSASI